MSVKIRLQQLGMANRRTFRIVAVDESKKRDGKVLEVVGAVNPLVSPIQVEIKRDRLEHWQKLGAQPTAAVKKLLSQV